MSKTPLNLAEVNQHLDIAYNIMVQAAERRGVEIYTEKSRSNYPASYYLGDLHAAWQAFAYTVRKTEFDQLTPGEQTSMRRLLSKIVTKRALQAATYILADEYNAAKNVIEDTLPTTKLKTLQTIAAQRYARRELTTLNPQRKPGKPSSITAIPATAPLPNFPNLPQINSKLTTAVNHLQHLWTQAIKLPDLTDENRFLLIETANTYLPDAWRMYANLCTMPDAIKQQAANMLLLQVDALDTRIRTITGTIGTTALKNLRAHTTFIIQKKPMLAPEDLKSN